MPPIDPPDPDLPEEPAADRGGWRRPNPRALAWGGFAVVLMVLVLYLVVPAFRYGANLSPPGPAAWDQPGAAPKKTTVPPVTKPVIEAAPVEEPPDNAATTADDTNTTDDVDTHVEASTTPDEAGMLRAIDRARFKALDSGDAKHWDGGGHEGYVVPSPPVLTGTRECRNLVVTIFTDGGQPRSSTDRYCRDDEDAEWALQRQ